MLSDEMRSFLVSGQHPQKKAKALLALGGPATVRVQWRKYRDELMSSCEIGRRPWAYWMIDLRLAHQPAGEAGQLRMIRQLELYRDDAEREFVHKRLAALTEQLVSRWRSRRVA